MPEPATITLVSTGCLALGVFRYLKQRYVQAKPCFDRVAAAILLVPCAPVIGLAALAVKLTSRGPAFYKQKRVGLDGQVFDIVKLRSMRCDAEQGSGPVWATDNDPRVTAVGQFLRKTHLDELPQLINVMKGEMSLVGPRPERPHFVEHLRESIPGYDERLKVKPGITGLAQVSAGPDQTEEDVRRKLELDTTYISRMCWWMDFMVMLRTLAKFTGERAGKGGK